MRNILRFRHESKKENCFCEVLESKLNSERFRTTAVALLSVYQLANQHTQDVILSVGLHVLYLNEWSRVPLGNPQQVNEFPTLYGYRRFIAVFSRILHLSLS
jgi:hypothetical protein